MGAPDNAITLRREAELVWMEEDKDNLLSMDVICGCGFTGTLGDLLCDPEDDSDEANNFWCPQCRAKAWYFV